MTTAAEPVSNFFLSIYQHELANCLNTFNQLSVSLIQHQNIDEGTLSDIEFDRAQVFSDSQRLLTKMRALLYPDIILSGKRNKAHIIIQNQLESLPPNPFKIINEADQATELNEDLFSLFVYSAIQLLIKNEADQYDARNEIRLSSSASGISIKYTSENKYSLFKKLADGSKAFEEKSNLAFEYEFLKLVFQRSPFSLSNSKDSSGFFQTEFIPI